MNKLDKILQLAPNYSWDTFKELKIEIDSALKLEELVKRGLEENKKLAIEDGTDASFEYMAIAKYLQSMLDVAQTTDKEKGSGGMK